MHVVVRESAPPGALRLPAEVSLLAVRAADGTTKWSHTFDYATNTSWPRVGGQQLPCARPASWRRSPRCNAGCTGKCGGGAACNPNPPNL